MEQTAKFQAALSAIILCCILSFNPANNELAAAPCLVSFDTVFASTCSNQPYIFNGQADTVSGNYNDTLTNISGCDSIVTLVLTVLQAGSSTVNAGICAGQSYTFNGRFLSTGGTYIDTVRAANGCDSVVTLYLTVNQPATYTYADTICAGQQYPFNGMQLSTGGTYNARLTGSNGCDSTVTLNLTVIPVAADTLSQTICSNDSFVFNGRSFTVAGTYNDTLQTGFGCDSFVTLQLTVNPAPVVSLCWDSMVAANIFYLAGNDTFFCPFGAIHLSGGHPFGGSYSGTGVISDSLYSNNYYFGKDTITYTYTDAGGCTNTASDTILFPLCIGITDVPFSSQLQIRPNPASTTLYISITGGQPQTTALFDISGQQVYTGAFEPELDVSKLSPGVYFIEIMVGEEVARKMFVKM